MTSSNDGYQPTTPDLPKATRAKANTFVLEQGDPILVYIVVILVWVNDISKGREDIGKGLPYSRGTHDLLQPLTQNDQASEKRTKSAVPQLQELYRLLQYARLPCDPLGIDILRRGKRNNSENRDDLRYGQGSVRAAPRLCIVHGVPLL
ncbi:MAG: hypothetical protein L0219_07785 [Phycisphaerales bacterium]|nr:hypothetical protein [Phycisphaerales bacterium]